MLCLGTLPALQSAYLATSKPPLLHAPCSRCSACSSTGSTGTASNGAANSSSRSAAAAAATTCACSMRGKAWGVCMSLEAQGEELSQRPQRHSQKWRCHEMHDVMQAVFLSLLCLGQHSAHLGAGVQQQRSHDRAARAERCHHRSF